MADHRVLLVEPADAHVAFFLLTDKQYGMAREYLGRRNTKKKRSEPSQVELF